MISDKATYISALMHAFSEKNLEQVMSLFAEDATMIDPHYPEKIMCGKEAIMAGIAWAFKSMKKPAFKLLNTLTDDRLIFAETEAHHVFNGGASVTFKETFVIELKEDGLISRLQAYPDYGPGGMVGFFLGLQRLFKVKPKRN